MPKRYILGAVVIIAAIIAIFLFLAPATVDPGADKMPDDITGPGEEGMIATGSPSTASASPDAAPPPGEVQVKQPFGSPNR
jgi:hypothetical protein